VQEFTAPRWQVPDDVLPNITRGDRLLQEYSFPLDHVRFAMKCFFTIVSSHE
jgi:hypothetical protein